MPGCWVLTRNTTEETGFHMLGSRREPHRVHSRRQANHGTISCRGAPLSQSPANRLQLVVWCQERPAFEWLLPSSAPAQTANLSSLDDLSPT